MKNMFRNQLVFAIHLTFLNPLTLWAGLKIDVTDPQFAKYVKNELDLMREGERGLVCQQLIMSFDVDTSTTVVQSLTRDEETWHPNDGRGTRSHVVADDFLVRGAARPKPTNATLYLHYTRIDPKFSSFKLGTFVHQLSIALDLNRGNFSPNYQTREKRASFYRNAWRDSLGYPLMERAGNVETPEFLLAKEQQLINDDHRDAFPILDFELPEEEEELEWNPTD